MQLKTATLPLRLRDTRSGALVCVPCELNHGEVNAFRLVCAELIPTSALLYAQRASDSRKCSKNKRRSCLTTKFSRTTAKQSQERSSGCVRLKVMPCCLFVSITRHAAVALLSNARVIKQRRRTAETKVALNFLVRTAPDARFASKQLALALISYRFETCSLRSLPRLIKARCVSLNTKQLLLHSRLDYLHDRHGVKINFPNHLFVFLNSDF